jgi:hypothetical protein
VKNCLLESGKLFFLHDTTKRIIVLLLHLATFPYNKQHTTIKTAVTSLMKRQYADELNGVVIMVEAR